jgi:hypothetical protein
VRTIQNTGKIYARGNYARITSAGVVPAPEVAAAALGVEPGEPIVARSRVTVRRDTATSSDAMLPGLAPKVPGGDHRGERIRRDWTGARHMQG